MHKFTPRIRRDGKRCHGGDDRQDRARDRTAGSRFAAHICARASASGNLGGWQVGASAAFLQCAGRVGGHRGRAQSERLEQIPFRRLFDVPPPQKRWNELHFPQRVSALHITK